MPTPSRERVSRFEAFTLDRARCVLLRNDVEVPLRPKPFDMLCYLAEHPGRLLPKEELLEAIWPGATVSEDALFKCMADVREALGDRRDIIKTIPKRGYLFDAIVSEEAVEPPSRRAISLSLPTSGERGPVAAAARLLAQTRRRPVATLVASVLAAAVLVTVAGIGAWALRAPPPLASGAAHFAILGTAILQNERSAKANREALALFVKALAIDPDSIPALLGYGRVMVSDVGEGWIPSQERSARLDQAKAAVARAIKVAAGNAGAHQLLGDVLRLRGDQEAALAALERALALDPGGSWTHALLGRVKIELGRAGEALGDVETALRIKPSEVAIAVWYCWGGMAALHAGRDGEAVQWLEKARKARPDYRLPMPFLAVAYAATGREDEARALMAEYLGQTPSLTMESMRRHFPSSNPIVAEQRRRIAAVLLRLGVPEGPLQTGSVR